jgi:hypothetical protein
MAVWAVMAAAVQPAINPGRIGKDGVFLDRQCIHIRAQPHDAPALRALAVDASDDAGLANPGDDLVHAHLRQALCDQTRRALDLEGQFGMRVKVLPPRDEFRKLVVKIMHTFHVRPLS